ncbi:MAG TPA: DUF4234 domain-containing protein [Acidimicrobiia bacterium]
MTNTPPPAPAPPVVPPAERVRLAYQSRPNSDYIFVQPGLVIFLTIITFGIYGYFVFYQLFRRMRDHNQRRLDLLEGATEFAWGQATERGVAEELRPNFERVAAQLQVMRGMTTDFRDPAIWIVILIVAGGIGHVVGAYFLDGDLIKHDQASGAVEAELAVIFGRLGETVPAPDPGRVKGPHNYVGRIVATIFTCGIYLLWWQYNLMVDGNRSFEAQWPTEDAIAGAVYRLSGAASA